MSDSASFQGLDLDVVDFFRTINHDSDMVAVLRGHLYVEATLTALIGSKYKTGASLLNWLDFWKKATVARNDGLIESQDKAALQALGNIRDSFAHLPIKMDLTTEDDDTIYKTMKGKLLSQRYQAFNDVMLGEPPDSTKPGRKVRAAIGALFDVLTIRLMNAGKT